jgi:hypothetical protein
VRCVTCWNSRQDYGIRAAEIGPCPGNGLIAGGHITLDLNGFTISGQGQGIGVQADGISILGPGTISNFDTGIRILRGTSPANPNIVSNLSLTGNDTGVVLPQGSVFTRVIGNTITGGGVGISVIISGAKIKGNVITNNSRDGINVVDSGNGLVIVSNTVNGNNRGLSVDFVDRTLSNDPITVRSNDFSGNNATGVSLRGTNITFETNTVIDNGGDGIVLSSHGANLVPVI